MTPRRESGGPARWLRLAAAWLAAGLLLVFRHTCRYEFIDDPRPELRARGETYLLALLHAHQLGAVFANDEPPGRLAAMVSRSADGDLLIPSLRVRGVLAARGSTSRRGEDKGGRKALDELEGLVRQGIPCLIAVDGPRGPRNHIHRGVSDLAKRTGTAALPLLVFSSRRWILARTWDRFQIPRPFGHVRVVFGEPLRPREGEGPGAFRQRIATALAALERRWDPDEAPAPGPG